MCDRSDSNLFFVGSGRKKFVLCARNEQTTVPLCSTVEVHLPIMHIHATDIKRLPRPFRYHFPRPSIVT
jgi:hypothetical protein